MSDHSSGNLAADRRYVWAEASRKEGDLAGAADLFAQALDVAPGWAAAAFALGECCEALGRTTEATEAFALCLTHAPGDPFGAGLRLARLRGDAGPPTMPDRYVAQLFDDYADRFDHHLVDVLGYRAPQLLAGALARAAGADRAPFAQGLDLGCGTGLMARALHGRVTAIDGIDLSARMTGKAGQTGLYRQLITGEVVEVMNRSCAAASYDLVVAADVLVYIGDLGPLFAAAARVLAPGGWVAVTVQAGQTGYRLGRDMRYCHGRDHLTDCAHQAGLVPVLIENSVLRRDGDRDVAGLLAILRPAGGT